MADKAKAETAATHAVWLEDQIDATIPWLKDLPSDIPNKGTFQPFVLILCGLPGSGKSTFSRNLERLQPHKYVRVNQDELGDRHRCVEKARRALVEGKCPIIDRCNHNAKQRRHWIVLAREFECSVTCICLCVPESECLARCKERSSHPTLTPSEAARVIRTMKSEKKEPTNSEGIAKLLIASDDVSCRKAFISLLSMGS
jgi:predicted kinase